MSKRFKESMHYRGFIADITITSTSIDWSTDDTATGKKFGSYITIDAEQSPQVMFRLGSLIREQFQRSVDDILKGTSKNV